MRVEDVITYLKEQNTFVSKSLLDGFVNDITVKYLPLYFFEYFSLNENAQRKTMSLSENQIVVLSKILKYSENNNVDWIPLSANFSHFLENNNFTNLVTDLEQNELTDDLIEKFLFVICNSRNYFKINSINDLRNLESIRNERQNHNTNDPNIILLNKYGISYDAAFNIYKRYGKDIKELPESTEKDFLIDIENIIQGRGTNRSICDNYNLIINIDSKLRNLFSNIYNNGIYNCEVNIPIGNIEGVPIYDAGVEFLMCIYSYGLATNLQIPQNFKDDWNRPSISVDYMCNSIINSLNMKTHIKHCVFGFSNIGQNELALLGSNDLGTGGIYREVNVTNPYHQDKLIADVEFRTPNELINNTRFTNNEVYRSRRRNNKGKLERINPDYIVYFKTGENNESEIQAESLKAAKDFGIPIVIIDCEKCLLHNLEKIEYELQLFESRYDDAISIKSIIEKIYTLTTGYRDIAPQLLEKYLQKDKLLNYINRISMHIDKISTMSPKTALDCINVFLETLDDEFEKILKSPYWVQKAREQGYVVEKPLDIIEIFKNKKSELENIDYSIRNNYQM